MSPRVRVLSDETINQIAAGEVIENPASVVKELVENALDAGAKRIFVEITGGGLHSIQVSDDGFGMQKDDALLCLERHATSKISRLDDLNHLVTLGFRGEALPSIAAISNFSLLTAAEDLKGTQIEIAGGKILHVTPGARARGTTVDVKNLFFNVPARKKFQKSAAICGAEIIRLMSQLALSHPRVAFECVQNGQIAFEVEKTERFGERIEQVLGDPLFQTLFPIEASKEGMRLFGFIGHPLQTRPNRMGQYLIMNGRPVICYAISGSVREGYATRIAQNRFPVFVLHLELAGDRVDVNVHPQKREVRFHEEERLKKWVQEQVGLALQKSETVHFSNPSPHIPNPIEKLGVWKEDDLSLNNSLPASTQFTLNKVGDGGKSQIQWLAGTAENQISNMIGYNRVLKEEPLKTEDLIKDEIYPLGIFKHFLFLNEQEELIVIDLRAAEARLIFDALTKEYSDVRQGLMIPETLLFSPIEAKVVEKHLELFEKLGFSIRFSGKNAVLIDAIPPFFEVAELSELFHQFCEDLGSTDSLEIGRQKIAAAASRFGRARKTHFMLEEGLAIWERVKKASISSFCPRGRPIWKKLGNDAIEKWLKN